MYKPWSSAIWKESSTPSSEKKHGYKLLTNWDGPPSMLYVTGMFVDSFAIKMIPM